MKNVAWLETFNEIIHLGRAVPIPADVEELDCGKREAGMTTLKLMLLCMRERGG